ncbi:MAG: hypothetical protein KAQ87_04230 [Candidatus Pacebacteria bacterium]|nr:hypothetical protein [Candidatus Paceibacterota bacterium]
MFLIGAIVTGIMLGLVVIALAYKEAQMEGRHPWAAALPCWRKTVSWFPKELTGYHTGLVSYTITLVAFTITACIFILKIYGIEVPIELFGTLAVFLFSLLILLSTFEDFMWHIVNPYQNEYGLHTFMEKKYPAFKGIFVWIMPIDYFFTVVVSFVLANFVNLAIEWIVIVVVLLVMTTIITMIRQKSLQKGGEKLKTKECLPVIVAAIVFVAMVVVGLMSVSSVGGYGSGFLSVMTVSAIAAAMSFMSYILIWGILKLLRKNNNNDVV